MAFDITTARPVERNLDIPQVRREQLKSTPFLSGESRVQKIISERADPVETLREEVETPFDFSTPKQTGKSLLKPFVTTAKLAAVPIEKISAAVGGLGLGLQKEKGFKESLEMAGRGFKGEEQFRAFDPVTAAGAPPIVATGLDLMSQILIPLKVLGGVNKLLRGPITKINDKKLLKVGKDLIKASDDAVKPVGTRLNKVYEPINDIKVDPSKTLDDVAKLPKEIINHIEDNLGNLDDFLKDFNIQKARELKRVIGELRPTAFGKAEKGAIDLITDKKINKAYGTIKQSMQKSLRKVKLDKEARKLLEADDLFSKTKNASRVIKRTITDPTLREPTKIGRAASGLEKEADITFRRAINILKESGSKQSRLINRAVSELEQFNRLQKIQKFGGSLGRSAVVGGVGGAAAGKVIKPILGQQGATGGQTGQNLP